KIIAVYRPGQVRDLPSVIAAWRARARAAGVGELFVLNVNVDVEFDGLGRSLHEAGLDGTLGFPPHNHYLEGVHHQDINVDPRFKGVIFSYQALVADAERKLRSGIDAEYFPGVMVAF